MSTVMVRVPPGVLTTCDCSSNPSTTGSARVPKVIVSNPFAMSTPSADACVGTRIVSLRKAGTTMRAAGGEVVTHGVFHAPQCPR